MTYSDQKDPEHAHSIVLFDSDCMLCNRAVQWIIKNDKNKLFKFAGLKSKIGQELCARYGVDQNKVDSMVLIENNAAFLMSDAALRISKKMDRLWPILVVFRILPRPIRDIFYRVIAQNRQRWFGISGACMVMTKESSSRFLV